MVGTAANVPFTRRSLSSGAHSRDPVAGDDTSYLAAAPATPAVAFSICRCSTFQ